MSEPWKRPVPARTHPRRGAGGLYRTADVAGRSKGIPIANANEALVAAVRLAYRVAESQVDRSSRLAARLRDAGDRVAGGDSTLKSLDATERLVMKSMLSALEWWETSVAQGRCPVKRLAAAEYRMMGQVLGLATPSAATAGTPQAADAPAAAPPARARPQRKLRVVLRGQRRPVRVVEWRFDGGEIDPQLEFFHEEAVTLAGELALSRSAAVLTLHFPEAGERLPLGRWSAAICSPGDEQLGFIEIAL